MNRASRSSIIPKIIIFLGTLSIVGIILLFFRGREERPVVRPKPDTDDKLFTEIIRAAEPLVLRLWTEGHALVKDSAHCKEELVIDPKVGPAYLDCQPHLWQCFWQGGLAGEAPEIKLELFGQTYHVKARDSFPAIPAYSGFSRYYQLVKLAGAGIDLPYGYEIELTVTELPGLTQKMILSDTCRDSYLPERIYGAGKREDKGEGFLWDNFGRDLFIDRFYVTQQMVNEWKILTRRPGEIVTDRSLWPRPALLSLNEQREYCAYFGKKLLTAELFDAAAMTPTDFKDPRPVKVVRAQTPWQRDLSKTFLGVARINPDYQLTPLDCQLAQVKGCPEWYFTMDSASWMGMNYSLGFFAESLQNSLSPKENLKRSSRELPPDSRWHELGARSFWDGKQTESPVAFRCYEEVAR